MKRQATIKRISKETEIELTLKLDGTRNYTIDTGIGFLNHMLELLAFHGELDLQILCKGDLKVDSSLHRRYWYSFRAIEPSIR